MANVTPIGARRPVIDLPMEVLGVLMRQAEPTVCEIAHDIEMQRRQRLAAADITVAIASLRALGYEIHEHDDPDGVRYELVQGGDAA